MRATLLDWLPPDLRGRRVLDAGCGTGALAVEAARRGADVVAIDLSPTLVGPRARARAAQDLGRGHVEFRVGDMLDPALGDFDHVVAMDSLIHYRAGGRRARARRPRRAHHATRSCSPSRRARRRWRVMHAVGRLFPRGDRAPAIEPVARDTLQRRIAAEPRCRPGSPARTQRIARGFYTSQALELARR